MFDRSPHLQGKGGREDHPVIAIALSGEVAVFR
jgi:hypothetical protein